MNCDVDGCERTSITRGLCSTHYARWRRNGEPGPAVIANNGKPVDCEPTCSVDDCDREVRVKSRGLCSKHYSAWQRTGSPTGVAPKRVSHGLTGYDYHGCRCDVCKAAKAQSRLDLIERHKADIDVPHGTIRGYTLNLCRCDACREAAASKNRTAEARERRNASATERRLRRWRNGPDVEFKHGVSGYGSHGCHCHVCLSAVRERQAGQVEEDRRVVGQPRHGREPWTATDVDFIVERQDMSDRELGKVLGRSVKAIRTARYRALHDPQWMSAFRTGLR